MLGMSGDLADCCQTSTFQYDILESISFTFRNKLRITMNVWKGAVLVISLSFCFLCTDLTETIAAVPLELPCSVKVQY